MSGLFVVVFFSFVKSMEYKNIDIAAFKTMDIYVTEFKAIKFRLLSLCLVNI